MQSSRCSTPSTFASESHAHPGPATSRIDTILSWGCVVVAFLVPIRLSLTYIALIPLILLWAYHTRLAIHPLCQHPLTRTVVASFVFLLTSIIISSFVGLSPGHSARPLLSLIFFTLTTPLFFSYGDLRRIVIALLSGQTIAAIHSFLDATFPDTIPTLFLGKVTESGQLALTILIAFGAIVSLKLGDKHESRIPTPIWRVLVACGAAITVALTGLGFRVDANLSPTVSLGLVALAIAAFAVALTTRSRLAAHRAALVYLLAFQAPLLVTALLVNLKRGPWLGVLVGTSIFCLLFARRLLLLVVASSIILATAVTPIRERLLDSYSHFTISGGRSTIWRIGAELTTEYPLGIGYHNSGILREFAPEIPPELKHFHNNILNIVAENGWLSAALFIWFLVAVLRVSFADTKNPLYVAIGCAIISWQTAGLVEYNFGDSEVMIIVWILVGLLLQGTTNSARDQRSSLS